MFPSTSCFGARPSYVIIVFVVCVPFMSHGVALEMTPSPFQANCRSSNAHKLCEVRRQSKHPAYFTKLFQDLGIDDVEAVSLRSAEERKVGGSLESGPPQSAVSDLP